MGWGRAVLGMKSTLDGCLLGKPSGAIGEMQNFNDYDTCKFLSKKEI